MSKRKPHNLKARIARSCRSLLTTNHVAMQGTAASTASQLRLRPRRQYLAEHLTDVIKTAYKDLIASGWDRHSRRCVFDRRASRPRVQRRRRVAPGEGRFMRRIARFQQRKRQTWLALPASGIEEVGHGCSAERTIGKGCGETKDSRRGRIATPHHGRNPPGFG